MTDHFALPFSLDASGHPNVREQDSLEHVADQVEAALRTRPGDRDELPSWGTDGLEFREQPLDLTRVAEQVAELIPAADVLAEQDPDELVSLVEQGVAKVNFYVSGG